MDIFDDLAFSNRYILQSFVNISKHKNKSKGIVSERKGTITY